MLGKEGPFTFHIHPITPAMRDSVARAHYRIQFPIAQSGAVLHNGWTLLDGDPVGKVPTTTIRPIAFMSLARTPQMPKQGPMGAFVVIGMLVDPFVADGVALAHAQPSTDLFRTPLFLQQAIDSVPSAGGNAASDFGAAPGQGKALGWLRAIAPHPLIPTYSATNGRFVHAYHMGDLLMGMSSFQQGLNLIALFQGQLGVRFSLVLLLRAGKRSHDASATDPFNRTIALHLQLEFTSW